MPIRSSLIPQRPDVLIVCNRPDAVRLITSTLEGELRVHCVDDATDAERHVSAQGAQVILIDLASVRPVFIQRLRVRKKTRAIPVLAFGQEDRPHDVLAAIRAGARGYLNAPITASAVRKRVRSVLGLRAA